VSDERKRETLAAQALGWIDPTTHAIVPPIHPSASYQRAEDGSYPGGHSYTRDQNPTYDQTEALLAALEGGEQALLFASGMAAATTLFEALDPGTHVVAPEQMYWTIRLWLEQLAEKGRIALDFVPNGDLDALRAAITPGRTKLVWLETPSNPLCQISDIAASTEIAHAAGALVGVDGTLATPALTRPLALGADFVMHSATKQLNGHADVLAGALVTRESGPLWDRIRTDRGYRGAVLGPFETWLLQRGMRTLFLRVRKSAANAQAVAEALRAHPEIREVYYPGLPDHPDHAIAARQMDGGFGPLVSFRAHGGEARAHRLASALEVFHRATSLGGVESLVEHRASVEGPGTSVPDDLLRLSIGIEDVGDLIRDLERALAGTSTQI
jgi:cystathionine gamma-synthase